MTLPVVIDASSIIALLIDPGDGGARVAHRIELSDLHAPDHVPVEVTNVLRRHRRADLLSPAEAGMALETFWNMPIRHWPFEALRHRTWDLGANLSSCDGAHVALGEHLGAPLVTRDARLARAPGVCSVRGRTGGLSRVVRIARTRCRRLSRSRVDLRHGDGGGDGATGTTRRYRSCRRDPLTPRGR